MNKRIKEVRVALGLTQDEFGRRLGLGRGAITNIELEKVTPKETFVDLLCKEFNVSKEWLHTGSGDMFVQRTRNQEIGLFVNEVMQDENDAFRKRFITMLSSLSVEEWQVLEKMAQKMTEGR